MIIKVSRISRTGKEWENYVYLPDTYSFHAAIKHISQSKGITKNKRTKFEQIFDEANFTKPVKHFDFSVNRYKPAK